MGLAIRFPIASMCMTRRALSMLGLRAVAALLSLAEHVSRCIWPEQRPSKQQPEVPDKLEVDLDHECSGARFLVNHPYQGLYSHVNILDAKSGFSLLFVIDGGAKEVHDFISAALRGETTDRVPTAVLQPGTQPQPGQIPDSW